MSNPLSREARDAMRARAAKATPGPWRRRKLSWSGGFGTKSRHLVIGDWWDSQPLPAKDAEFIAHARTDVPTLLDALESAEALVSTLGSALERYADETAWTDGVCEFRATPNRDPWGSVVDWTGVHDNGALARAALASYQEWDRSRTNPKEQ